MFRVDGYSELLHGFQLALEVSGLRPSTIKHYTTSKQVVASSNLVSRSILMGRIPAVLYTVHETRVIGACGFKSRRPYHFLPASCSAAPWWAPNVQATMRAELQCRWRGGSQSL